MTNRLLDRLSVPESSSSSALPGKELSESVRELHVPTGHVEMEIVFFHGLDFGEQRDFECRAWMSADGRECWPQTWLPERLPGARILAVSYDASAFRTSSGGRMDVEIVAENLVSELILCEDVAAGQGLHCPLVLVGHSVGGMVIKQLCRHAFHKMKVRSAAPGDQVNGKRLDAFLKNLRGVFYYSTPHGGSPVAKLAPWYKKRGSIMEIIDFRSRKAAALNAEFNSIRRIYKDNWSLAGVVESHVTKLPGFRGVVVDIASAKVGNGFGELLTVSEDHFSISRPRCRTSLTYQSLVAFLTAIEEQEKPIDIQTFFPLEKYLVGVFARVKEIETILQTVPTLGLYGMGGVGKTTLAKAILEACHLQFDYTFWIPDLKELVERESGPRLKSCIMEGLFQRGRKVAEEDADWHILKGKKVLVVVDNVDSEYQLQKTQIPSTNWFEDESKVIITSRDKGFCKRRFHVAWNVEFLTDHQSSELFLHHAFEKDEPPSHVMTRNLDKVLNFCHGVPLAIEVIGRTLHKESDERIWEAAIQKLKEGEPVDGSIDDHLLNSLRLSYDGLRPEEQKMFLDSALVLRHEPVSKALQIWKGCWGPGVPKSWQNLTFKCLVDVEDDNVWVHDTLGMLAQNIACPKHDDGHMRNWLAAVNAAEVAELLSDPSQEPCKAERLVCWWKRSSRRPSGLHGERITEEQFPHLRLLTLVNIEISGDAVRLPSRLVYLRWSDATRTTMPFLVRHLTRLCCLDLTECEALESIPHDVDRLTALTRLELGGCRSLSSVPDGIGNLTELVYFGAKNSGLREIPFLEKLTNLETLILGGSLVSKLPDSLGKMKKLKVMETNNTPLFRVPPSVVSCQSLSRLNLRDTSVSILPESFGAMRNLEYLNLSRTRLEMLPESVTELGALSTLDLYGTPLRRLPELIGNLGQLRELNLWGTELEALPPSSTRLENLSELYMWQCKVSCLPDGFENLRSLRTFSFSGCDEHVTWGNLPWESLESVTVGYVESLFDADGSTAGGIAQDEIVPGRPSASASERIARGGEGRDRAKQEREGHLLSEVAIGASCARIRRPFEMVSSLLVTGNASLSEFPRRLLIALSHMKALRHLRLDRFDTVKCFPEDFRYYLPNSLESLTLDGWRSLEELPEQIALSHMKALTRLALREFHAVRRLPEDFLPNSLTCLELKGWRSLEELPEAVGRLTTLGNLWLRDLDNLKRLPDTVDWPQLFLICVNGCENLGSLPAGAFAGCRDFLTDSWTLLLELVEKHGRQSQLRVNFWVRKKYWRALEIALPSWRSWTDTWRKEKHKLHDWRIRDEGAMRKLCDWTIRYEGEGIWEAMEALATVYGGDNGEAQRHFAPLSPSRPPMDALETGYGGDLGVAQRHSALFSFAHPLPRPLSPLLFKLYLKPWPWWGDREV